MKITQVERPPGPFEASDRQKILLVHGAFSDASGWARVIPLLQEAGYPVVAVQNNLETLEGDVANTRAVLDQLPGPVLVVGHSYGGAIVGGATLDASNVVGLVYIAAYAPDEGENIGDLNEKFAPTIASSNFRCDERGFVYIDPTNFGEAFAADAPIKDWRTMAATQRPIHASIFSEAAGPVGWRQHRVWYQVSKDDQTINPELERFFARRMNATTIELASSHASLVAHPREIADFILAAC